MNKTQPTPEKEIKKRFGFTRSQMEKRRNETDEDIDWFRSEDENGRIYWSAEQVAEMQRALEVEAEEEATAEEATADAATADADPRGIGVTPEKVPTPGGLNLRVISLARNKRYVYVDHSGVKKPVKISRGRAPQLIGKVIEVIEDASGEFQYTGQ